MAVREFWSRCGAFIVFGSDAELIGVQYGRWEHICCRTCKTHALCRGFWHPTLCTDHLVCTPAILQFHGRQDTVEVREYLYLTMTLVLYKQLETCSAMLKYGQSNVLLGQQKCMWEYCMHALCSAIDLWGIHVKSLLLWCGQRCENKHCWIPNHPERSDHQWLILSAGQTAQTTPIDLSPAADGKL